MSGYKVINTGLVEGLKLRDLEKQLLETTIEPTLHFYRFKYPSITYGYNIDQPQELLNFDGLQELGIQHGHRLTPGGCVFHMWDYTFSIFVPLDFLPFAHKVPRAHVTSYAFKYFNTLVKQALSEFSVFSSRVSFIEEKVLNKYGSLDSDPTVRFCMGNPCRLDIMKDGKKVCGAAEFLFKDTLLHHGTISLCLPDAEILKKTLKNPAIVDKMLERSFCFSDLSYKNLPALRLLQAKIEKAIFETLSRHPLTKQDLIQTQ
jgi:lipoate-protein ligase A